MELHETNRVVDYFLNADQAYLDGMGVDPDRLPTASEWLELLQIDFARPLKEKKFFYLVWEVHGRPIGHCNINKIQFGHQAFMHLHIWETNARKSGVATKLLRPSALRFFERFELKKLFCEPYAKNPAPNAALPKAGFRFLKTYETIPGWIAFHQPVNRWVLDRETALGDGPPS